jgi:hypothetical protein
MTYGRPGVYINETLLTAPIASSGAANAAGAALGVFSQGPTALTLVTSWYDFVKKFGGFSVTYPATFGVNQFFANGGTELYVKRIVSATTLNGTKASVGLPKSTGVGAIVGTVTSKIVGSAGNSLRVRIYQQSGSSLYNFSVYQESVPAGTDVDATTDVLLESYDNLVFNDVSSVDYAATVVNMLSATVTMTLTGTDTPATQALTAVLPLSGAAATDATVLATDYTAALAIDGTSELDNVSRPLVLFAPELYRKFYIDNSNTDATAKTSLGTVQDQMITWANSGSGFAVLDTAPGLTTNAAIDYATTKTASSQAAVYYPNVYISDPVSTRRGALRLVGPAGAVAGLYLATDKLKGPFKAPAGINTQVTTAVSLERSFTSADLDSLNNGTYGATVGKPVNAVRNVPGSGVVVMGARTLKQDGTANRYVSMRRSLIYIKKRIENATAFAVFQNNDYKLWAQINTALTVFLNEYRNQGGLTGATPAQSFYVKVDGENNTSTTIATGVVNIEVGVALQYPAEFVVINLSQITGN